LKIKVFPDVVISKIHENLTYALEAGKDHPFDEGDRIKFDKGVSVIVRKKVDLPSSQDSNSKPHNNTRSNSPKKLVRSSSSLAPDDCFADEAIRIKKDWNPESLSSLSKSNLSKSPYSSPTKAGRTTRSTSALANDPIPKTEIDLDSIYPTQLFLAVLKLFDDGTSLANLTKYLNKYSFSHLFLI
jgi:hypothetical protein